jgi:hypothetical protein
MQISVHRGATCTTKCAEESFLKGCDDGMKQYEYYLVSKLCSPS